MTSMSALVLNAQFKAIGPRHAAHALNHAKGFADIDQIGPIILVGDVTHPAGPRFLGKSSLIDASQVADAAVNGGSVINISSVAGQHRDDHGAAGSSRT